MSDVDVSTNSGSIGDNLDVGDAGTVDTVEQGANVLGDSEPSGSSESYTVKVGGEEKEVSLDELVSGYQMQSDYTRKTQALAEEKARLADAERIVNALREDPSGTLQTLSQVYGVNLGTQDRQDSFDSFGYQDDPKPNDETVQRLARIEQALEAQQQSSQKAALQNEIDMIRETFGEFDVDEVLTHAIQNNLPSVSAAYRDLNFDRILAQQREAAQRETKRQQKRETAGLTHSGSGGGADSGESREPGEKMSLREAYLAAKRLHGAN